MSGFQLNRFPSQGRGSVGPEVSSWTVEDSEVA